MLAGVHHTTPRACPARLTIINANALPLRAWPMAMLDLPRRRTSGEEEEVICLLCGGQHIFIDL